MTQFIHLCHVSIPLHSILFIGWNEAEDGNPAACIYLNSPEKDEFFVHHDSEDFKALCEAVSRPIKGQEMTAKTKYLVATFCLTYSEPDYWSIQYFDSEGNVFKNINEVGKLFGDRDSAQALVDELIEIGHEQPTVIEVTLFDGE